MDSKTTSDLSKELMSEAGLDAYLRDNCESFNDRSLTELLDALYQKKDITKAALAREANMSEVYLHQVFSGRRRPSRDRLLCLCVGLNTTLEECQDIMKMAGYAPLYPRNRRDVIITYGMIHHCKLGDINDKLFSENEKTLY